MPNGINKNTFYLFIYYFFDEVCKLISIHFTFMFCQWSYSPLNCGSFYGRVEHSRAVASLSLLGGRDKNISLIFSFSCIFSHFSSIFLPHFGKPWLRHWNTVLASIIILNNIITIHVNYCIIHAPYAWLPEIKINVSSISYIKHLISNLKPSNFKTHLEVDSWVGQTTAYVGNW